MLLDGRLVVGLAVLWAATGAHAACSSNLLIDDFTRWTSGTNNLGWANGDDGSMSSMAGLPGRVVFVPKDSNSYFYESMECRQAASEGYMGVQFVIEGPAGGYFVVEAQTTESCGVDRSTYKSSWAFIEGLNGHRQTVVLPFSAFSDNPNPDALVGLVWGGFSHGGAQWSVGNVTLVCSGPSSPTQGTGTTTTRSATLTTTTPPGGANPPASCPHLLIDDWASQSRLTFLGYNALGQASSDDGTMASVVVSNHRLQLAPRNTNSYLYSKLGCLDARATYGGVSFRVRAARGAAFSVTLGYVSTCGSATVQTVTRTTAQLGWTFDGAERVYSLPLSAFAGLDASKLAMIYLSGFSGGVTLGPMALYCGSTPSEYVVPAVSTSPASITQTTNTPSAPAPTQALVIDTFASTTSNDLGEWHGADDDAGMTVTFGNNAMTLRTNNSDLSWYTKLRGGCADMRSYAAGYLHIAFSGSSKFSVALQQHNARCDERLQPYPETWDSLEAARYAVSPTDIYMPLSHFRVNLTRAIGVALKGFYTTDATTITKIEIVPSPPAGYRPPAKLASGRLVFACSRPNSFAFAIDDGDPKYAARVMDTIRQAGIPVTFFTVGLPLLDAANGLAAAYRDMAARGHQIALHSYTHPKMEGLPDDAAIDWEYANAVGAVRQVFGVQAASRYFRPPFGTEGARMRQRLAAVLGDPEPYIVNWSVDVEDWLWADGSTPGKQLEAFQRDLARGGNLLVMHYLHESTVQLLPEFIRLAKATGKRLMRVDQCMEDPRAPPLT
ncbi:hypothetical protein VTJ83DRAFT_4149 [Remersonia thermophila]|uniref:NodB homology domain-containing protein n=1 Tax=Remersonia thermophila TaxID=72144 RepID=A0ABR4D927_9PEZI